MSRLNTVVAVNSISLRLGTVHLLLSNYVTVNYDMTWLYTEKIKNRSVFMSWLNLVNR